MKTGINSDGTLRGGGEEDWKFTNFTMTKVKNPFSIDCYYDKNYNSDPAVDKANARALDSTTPTYNGILLQNVKTTDVCDGKAIFLIGRPESHIKNVTLDNVLPGFGFFEDPSSVPHYRSSRMHSHQGCHR
jgi:hypothetical protein